MDALQRKKKFIIDVIYIAFVLVIFYFFMKYAFGLFLPFILALTVAAALQRPVNFICKKTPLKRGIVSVFLVLFSVTIILGLLTALVVRIGVELRGFVQYLIIQLQDIPSFIAKLESYVSSHLSFLPDRIESAVTSFMSDKVDSLLNNAGSGFDFSALRTPLLGVWNTVKHIPSTIVAIVISVVACCFMTADFATVRKIILSLFRAETRDKIIRSKKLLVPSLSKMAKAYGIIIVITFSELVLGLFLLKLLGIYEGGYIFIFALITAIIDIVPILGTGTVLVPWALYCLLDGKISLAIGIFVMYACITIIRQIIEPKLVSNQLGIPPFATIIAMYVGSQIFGVLGIFILPITLVMVKLLNEEGIIHIFHKLDEEKPKPAEKIDEVTDD
ncbi:MAG: sporulation integral membrane protein YtvI [Oscillospiraceae bacterium]|nr:sporulation integral membrane protein YtvI [Oscillospiraceae bacterium]